MFVLPVSVPSAKADIGFWLGQCKMGWAVTSLEKGFSIEFVLNLFNEILQIIVYIKGNVFFPLEVKPLQYATNYLIAVISGHIFTSHNIGLYLCLTAVLLELDRFFFFFYLIKKTCKGPV